MNSADYSQLEEKSWLAPTISHAVAGTVQLPGSKSLTNRELVLSALAATPSQLVSPLLSRDTQLMTQALEALGTQIHRGNERDNWTILPATTDTDLEVSIDCGLAGTVMRFVPPMAALSIGTIHFDGDLAARNRPMATTIESLTRLGIKVQGTGLPFSIHATGEVIGGELEIDASESSQFVSGLLLAAPRFKNGLKLRHVGKTLPSLPHIDMSIECLRLRGVNVYAVDESSWIVEPGPISGREVVIEPDLSNAGPFLAAALVTGGRVRVRNWPAQTTQVGKDFIVILKSMGAEINFDGNDLICSGTGKISGININMGTAGELAPVIIALAVLADSPSQITGIAHLRGHETDRLMALTTEINKLGGNAKELPDGIEINPAGSMHGGIWETYGDHRMATAAAIIGLAIEGITVKNINVVSKTMPEFVTLWDKLLGVSN